MSEIIKLSQENWCCDFVVIFIFFSGFHLPGYCVFWKVYRSRIPKHHMRNRAKDRLEMKKKLVTNHVISLCWKYSRKNDLSSPYKHFNNFVLCCSKSLKHSSDIVKCVAYIAIKNILSVNTNYLETVHHNLRRSVSVSRNCMQTGCRSTRKRWSTKFWIL